MSAGHAAVTTRPAPTPLGMEPSIGFGDRLGLGTPGHVAALREAGGRSAASSRSSRSAK